MARNRRRWRLRKRCVAFTPRPTCACRSSPSPWNFEAAVKKKPRTERGSLESQTAGVSLQALFESLAGAKAHGLGSLDLNRLAGLRIAAHARGALAHAERAEPNDLH